MKTVFAVVVLMQVAISATAAPQIAVELSGASLSSGATVGFGSMLAGASDVIQVDGGMPATTVIPGLPPGDYDIQRSINGVDEFSVLPFGPFQPNGNCEIRYDDPDLEFSFRFFYRALSVGVVRELTLTNSGDSDLTVTSVSVDPADPEAFDFEVIFPSQSVVIGAGGSETLTLIFRTFDVGPRDVSLLIESDSAVQSSFVLQLSGEGLALGTCPAEAPLAVTEVSITPATGISGAKLSAVVTGNPGGTIQLESSGDLGRTIPWLVIGEIMLDAEGKGSFNGTEDTRAMAAIPPRQWFFRMKDK